MKTLFRLDSSIRMAGSVSRELADLVERQWRDALPGAEVIRRDVGIDPLPACWHDAAARFTGDAGPPTEAQREAAALACTLTDELLAADSYLLAVPLYNFNLPNQVKAWFDLVITDARAADVNTPLLPGRPAVLISTRGGGYGPGTPRAGWDHATPYLRRMLEDIWGLDLEVVEVELTAAATNPALADRRRQAIELHQRGRIAASRAASGLMAPRRGHVPVT